MKKILCVCLGNICRSPLAEAALREEASKQGLNIIVDSAGIGGWHAGEAPDARSIRVAARSGVDIAGQRARQVVAQDFETFDYIFAMDGSNLMALREASGARHAHKLHLFGSFADIGPVADPYYGDEAGFDVCWQDVRVAAKAVVAAIKNGALSGE